MSACLYSEVFRVRGFQAAADEVRQHGIVTADVAAWLSGKKLGAVYLAGLLHDVGKLLIYKAASTQKPVGMPSPELVEAIAAEVHASIGVLVAHAWKLGPEVAAGIGFHHDPAQAPPEYLETARQVEVANIATHTAVLSRQGQDCGAHGAAQHGRTAVRRGPDHRKGARNSRRSRDPGGRACLGRGAQRGPLSGELVPCLDGLEQGR